MPDLILEGLHKRFGNVAAVQAVDLTIPEGELVCFLGPSGCGKTTLLRLIAGLETPSAGQIRLGGQDLTAVPTHRRGFGMVFQSLALFQHLSVGENIAYSLRIRGADRAAQRARVAELLELVQLPGIAGRHVSQLSGGQRQRVAIARALATHPAVFLLDEPLSALDAKLREAMQIELRLLQRRLGVTTILVTHDQREAMTMADRIVVMGEGRIRQVGPPVEIYRAPADTFVADFIGASNLLPVTPEAGGLRFGPHRLEATLPEGLNGTATLLVRPEEVRLLPAGAAGPNRLPGRVAFVRDVGATVETHVDCEGREIVSVAMPKDRPDAGPGEAVTVELPSTACRVLTS